MFVTVSHIQHLDYIDSFWDTRTIHALISVISKNAHFIFAHVLTRALHVMHVISCDMLGFFALWWWLLNCITITFICPYSGWTVHWDFFWNISLKSLLPRAISRYPILHARHSIPFKYYHITVVHDDTTAAIIHWLNKLQSANKKVKFLGKQHKVEFDPFDKMGVDTNV